MDTVVFAWSLLTAAALVSLELVARFPFNRLLMHSWKSVAMASRIIRYKKTRDFRKELAFRMLAIRLLCNTLTIIVLFLFVAAPMMTALAAGDFLDIAMGVYMTDWYFHGFLLIVTIFYAVARRSINQR
jgi:hypothetical protein